MDLFDEVINLESNAYEEGLKIGKKRVEPIIKQQSYATGSENGFYIGKEYGFIQGYTSTVIKEEHLADKYKKVIQSIQAIKIAPNMPAELINSYMLQIRNLFKQLLSHLKIKSETISSTDY